MIRSKKYRITLLLIKLGDVILDTKLAKKCEERFRQYNRTGKIDKEIVMSKYKMANEVSRLGKTEVLSNNNELKKAFNIILNNKQSSKGEDMRDLDKDRSEALGTVEDITNWFKAAKPNPSGKDVCTQMGCHFEEVAEMATAIRAHNSAEIINEIGDLLKEALPQSADNYLNKANKIELLDSLCDQIVTAIGVGYMMGFDMQGAVKEVIRSNNSKMVDGGFIFDDNGKISKPDSYSEPDLTNFLGGTNAK